LYTRTRFGSLAAHLRQMGVFPPLRKRKGGDNNDGKLARPKAQGRSFLYRCRKTVKRKKVRETTSLGSLAKGLRGNAHCLDQVARGPHWEKGSNLKNGVKWSLSRATRGSNTQNTQKKNLHTTCALKWMWTSSTSLWPPKKTQRHRAKCSALGA